MSETQTEIIKILIVSTQPKALAPVAHFLSRRSFSVDIKPTMKEALKRIADDKPDWIFLSLDLGPAVEKFLPLLKMSFDLEPIVFADIPDRTAMIRLEQFKGPVIRSRLTGPSIQLRLHQIVFDRNPVEALHERAAARPTTGVRRSSFYHAKGENISYGSVRINMGTTPVGPSKTVFTDKERSRTEDFRAVQNVDQIHVMVWEEKGVQGYMVVGGSLSAEESAAEAAKIQGRLLDGRAHVKDKFLGALNVTIESLPSWAERRSKQVQRYVTGAGEILTCFIPEPKPLPEIKIAAANAQKLEVKTADIPTEVSLPCHVYIHLKQNDRFVCLIKAQGHLSQTQRERLIKMGAENLHIDNGNAHDFNLFYIRQKLNVA